MRKQKKYKTTYLFPRTSVLIGAGSSISIWGNYFGFNFYKSEAEADARALENDWYVIGSDFKSVLERESMK